MDSLRIAGTQEWQVMDEANDLREKSAAWKPAQTYTLAAICLIIGLAIGYFLRGSASTAAVAAAESGQQDPHAGMAQQAMPSLDDMKRMADKQAEPLLAK